ncbi:MAG: ATP-binding cassette domain-containing protein [Anaerolineaceae bacterium]|nr:ATP-binding cassette domain-containing protein [Anaerolineaceae bacterium]
MDADKSEKPRSALRDLWQITSFLKPFKKQFRAALLIVVAMNFFLLARPIIIAKGFNALQRIIKRDAAPEKAAQELAAAKKALQERIAALAAAENELQAAAAREGRDAAEKILAEKIRAEREALANLPTRNEKIVSAVLPVLIYFVCGVIGALLLRFRAPIVMRLSVALLRDLRTRIYAKIQQLSFNHLDRLTNGQIIERATGDVNQIRNFLTMNFIEAFDAVVVAVLMAVAMVVLNARMALVAVAVFPLLLYLFWKVTGKLRLLRRAVRDEVDVMTSGLTEGIAGVRVIRSFGRQEMIQSRYRETLGKLVGLAMRVHVLRSFGMFGIFNLTRLPEILIIVFGGLCIIGAEAGLPGGINLKIGDLIGYLFFVRLLLWKLHPLMEVGAGAQEARAAFERIVALMEVRSLVADGETAQDLPPGGGKVEFRKVSFSYQEAPPPEADVVQRMAIEKNPATPAAIENVNLTVEPGEIIALVGPTGAGKSTIVSLLPRFYDPTEGQILIDGRDIREVRLTNLRRNVAMVFQETFLFRGTIAENIAYGQPEASRGEVIQAAEMAQAHGFIHEFPLGYDSEIGERGVSLSGGERQRVAIARAILMKPRILVLDDATASVDPVTEFRIRQGLRALMRGRTTLIIAHRLATIRSADRVVVLRDGRIEDLGRHDELIGRNEFYRALCESQSEELSGTDSPSPDGAGGDT